MPGNNDSLFPAISANGQVIAFMSLASNLVAADGSDADNGSGNSGPPAILPTDAIFQPNLRLVFSGGEPHLLYTYYDGTVSMHIAYRANGSWQTSTHPSPRALGGEPNFDALVLDNGNIAISYWDVANNDLRLILWDGANWLDSLIDTGPEDAEVGEFNAIARGIEMVGDTPVETLAIAYYDRTHRSIRYAHSATGIWQSRELIPDVGSVSGLDLAVAGDTYALPFQEMATIVRGDPTLLWDGHRVMQNFMPGLEAWVSGRGDEFMVTQQMADDALDIWQRIAAQAGPELSTAINAELAATNNLQNFVGESFDQWAEEIGVESTEEKLYLPWVRK